MVPATEQREVRREDGSIEVDHDLVALTGRTSIEIAGATRPAAMRPGASACYWPTVGGSCSAIVHAGVARTSCRAAVSLVGSEARHAHT
jgi:hypothetical protein